MGQLLDADNLVTAGMVVVRMGLTRIQRVHQLMRAQPPMPDPVYVGPRILLWNWPEIAEWARATGRPAIDPADWVTVDVIRNRLELEERDVARLVEASREDGGDLRVRWREAEALWIERTNRPR